MEGKREEKLKACKGLGADATVGTKLELGSSTCELRERSTYGGRSNLILTTDIDRLQRATVLVPEL